MHLQEVMHSAVEEPLDVHLPFASEGEPIESEGGAYVGEYRLRGCESSIIDEAALHRIDLPLHLLGKGLREGWSTSLEEVDLPCFGTVGISETFLTQGTDPAVGLIPPKLDGNSLVVDDDLGPVTVEAFAGRTDAVALILAHCKIACRIGSRRTKERGLLFSEAFLVAISIGKAGIPFPELGIGHIGIDTLLHEQLHVRFRMKAAIRGELGFVEYIGSADSSKVLPRALHHRLQERMFLGCAVGFGMDDDLVLVIDDRYAVIALDHAVGGLHGGALVVGDVALYGLILLTRLVVMLFEPCPDLLDVLLEGGNILLFLSGHDFVLFRSVRLSMAGDDLPDDPLHLLFLSGKVILGTAPFLGGIGGELAAVDGKHLLADEVKLITDEEDFEKEVDDLLIQGGDEVGNGGEVGGRITREGHEDNVLLAALLYLPAGGDAPGIGVEDDLQEDGGVIGRGAGIVIGVAGIEHGEVEFLVDQVIEGILEGAREDLLVKGDGNELALTVIVLFVACHPVPPCGGVMA
jgi:hypothetical protein